MLCRIVCCVLCVFFVCMCLSVHVYVFVRVYHYPACVCVDHKHRLMDTLMLNKE